ncbi:MAG: hypothetical protein P4M12_06595 [Gammaproteobacteria bacterium]|nr:hypothetical protein [Gammaproteobacteria bacterium]
MQSRQDEKIKKVHEQAGEVLTIVCDNQLKVTENIRKEAEVQHKQLEQQLLRHNFQKIPPKKVSCCERFCSFFRKEQHTLDDDILAPTDNEVGNGYSIS